jgi:hypothetical protein
MLPRAALIVRPKQPYLDWAASLDDSGLVPDVHGEMTVYLIPEFADDGEAGEILAEVYGEVFERELFGWHTDEATWPANRTLQLFREWFEIELHSMVEDLCGDEFIDDEA